MYVYCVVCYQVIIIPTSYHSGYWPGFTFHMWQCMTEKNNFIAILLIVIIIYIYLFDVYWSCMINSNVWEWVIINNNDDDDDDDDDDDNDDAADNDAAADDNAADADDDADADADDDMKKKNKKKKNNKNKKRNNSIYVLYTYSMYNTKVDGYSCVPCTAVTLANN